MRIRTTLSLCVILILVSGCRDAEPEGQAVPAAAGVTAEVETRVVQVETVSAETVMRDDYLIASGTIAAKQTSNIGALAEGVVEQIFVRVGDRVRKGDPLFRTRQVDYQRSLVEAEAMRDVALAEVTSAQTLVDRYTPLETKGFVSGVVFDNAKTALEVAGANLRLRETKVETAKQALGDTTVRAPFDGTITARYIDEGVFMANRFSGMGNSAVVQVQECGIAAAILFAPESELARLKLGLKGHLYVDGRSDPIESQILILNDRVDPTSRMVEFRMAFANPDCAVKAGQSVRAEVKVDPRSATVLPRRAIQGAGEDRYVYLVTNAQAKRRPVKITDIDADRVEILDGLTSGETVVLTASEPLYDGARIELTPS